MSAPPDRTVLSPSGDERLIAGALCLELCNTISRRYTDAPVERLPDYRALLSWATATGALDARTAARLTTLAIHEPRSAARVLVAAHGAARRDTRRVPGRGRARRTPAGGDRPARPPHPPLLRGAQAHGRTERRGLEWTAGDALMRPLWPVALSAAELLTSPDLTRVRECAGRAEGCGWLFLDSSRGSGRRWCTMEVCGNRAKARRHYRRAQQR